MTFKSLHLKYDGDYPENMNTVKFALPDIIYIFAVFEESKYAYGVRGEHSYRVRKDNFNRLMRLHYTDMLVDKLFIMRYWVILTESNLHTFNQYNKLKGRLVG